MQSKNDPYLFFISFASDAQEVSEFHQFRHAVLGQLRRADLGETSEALSEASNRERAKQAILRYIDEYHKFASGVLSDLRREKPDVLSTYRLLNSYAARELESLLLNVEVTTETDITKLETVVDAFTALMHATEYVDDRAAMIGHACSQFKARLQNLGLLGSTSHAGSVVFDAHLDLEELSRRLRAARNLSYHGQATRKSPGWLSPPSLFAGGHAQAPTTFWLTLQDTSGTSITAEKTQTWDSAHAKLLSAFRVLSSAAGPAPESVDNINLEQRQSTPTVEHDETARKQPVVA